MHAPQRALPLPGDLPNFWGMDTKIRKKKHDDLPATIRLVKEVRNELRAEIRSLGAEIRGLDADIQSLDAKCESRFEQLQAVAHRTQVLMEEQRGENRIVLDGLKMVLDRQDRMEREQSGIRRET